MPETASEEDAKSDSALDLKFLSHGTIDVVDIAASRKFYEDFFGLEVVRTSEISLMVRLGGSHIYAAVETGKKNSKMPFLYHNGLDVRSDEEVEACHRIVVEQAEKWGLYGITKPSVQHGTYSFYFWDMDDNCWEILQNPAGGYTWLFDKGDLEGRGHLSRDFDRTT